MASGADPCENLKKPGLVVFDLDYTLWPFWVDTHVTPPFMKKGSRVIDSRAKTVKHYPEVPEVLEYLHSKGIPMAVASRTIELEGAEQLIHLFGWNKYFAYKEIYPGSKLNHFQKFKDQTGLPYSSMIFFDDEPRNIRELSGVGTHCVFVKNGVSKRLLEAALKDFDSKQ